MNVPELLKWALEHKGYDGLCEPGLKCECTFDNFIPCGSGWYWCMPAYKHSDGTLHVEPEECNEGCRM